MRILLVEDEPNLGAAVREHINGQAHAVDWFMRLDDAEAALAGMNYELILLDLHLPDGRGCDLLKRLRGRGDKTPVIIVTAHDRVSDRIEGLNAGADDYLVKPFDLDELTARIQAVARRHGGNPNPTVKIDNIEIDRVGRRATLDGKSVDLTSREWALLTQFLRHPSVVLSKGQLEDALYEFGAEIESNAVEVYVSRLRKKLGRNFIHTVRGIGYRLEA